MSSPSSATFEPAGWSARHNLPGPGQIGQKGEEVPRTVERKRRGRGVDVMTLPTPPHSRQNTQLPTPETIRQPRKPTSARSKESQTVAVSFLPTPQTLPRQRTSLDAPAVSVSPSGQTTFIHSHSGTTADIPLPAPAAAVPRRRPGLTFAQQMGLLSSTSAPSGLFGGRLGVGVGMGGGHKSTVGHRGVDLIPAKAGMDKEEENPFYVSPTTRPTKRPTSPRSVLRSSTKAMLEEDASGEDDEEDEEMAGPSSPLAGRSPLFPSSVSTDFLSIKRPRISPPAPTLTIPSTPGRSTLAPAPHLSSPTPIPSRLRQSAKLHSMLQDAEHNPFLSRPTDHHAPTHTPGMDEADRPYVTYVFRGSKKVFANPFSRPDMPFPPADLRPEDEGFEEHPCPKPRLLWPSKPSGRGMRDDDDEEEVTPSPPSSPIRTPRTNHKSRFLTADRSLEGGMFNPPAEVYSDSEEERERVVGGSKKGPVGVKGRAGRGRVDSDDEEQEEEEEPVVRRGLLFGPKSTASAEAGSKRTGEEVERDGKKAKTLRM